MHIIKKLVYRSNTKSKCNFKTILFRYVVPLKCPLVLQLINSDNETAEAFFDDDKDKVYTDFSEVRDAITRITNEKAGSEKKIVNSPIYLTIQSAKVPNLLLLKIMLYIVLFIMAKIRRDIKH